MSGGVTGAQAGTLSFMVGGDAADYKKVNAVLRGMGKNLFHCGAPGTGSVAKVTNNLILALHMIALGEALQLGEKLGGDPKKLSEIYSVSTGRSWSVDTYNPVPGFLPNVPASKNYDGGFMVKLMLKDLGLALESAKQCNGIKDSAESAHALYKKINDLGYGDKDFGFAYQYIKNDYNLPPGGK